MASSHENAPSEKIASATRRLLRPLLRLLVRSQITLGRIVEMIKGLLVEVAEEEIGAAGAEVTDTRVHLLTGVHRKDVRRLRREKPRRDDAPASVSIGGQIVARWTSDRAYLDARGKPAPLPFRGGSARDPSFSRLVDDVSRQDVRPRAALEEMLRLGVVSVDEQETIRLKMEAFVPEKGFEEKAFYFGQNIGDHIAAGAHNLQGGKPPFIDRSVYYDGLSAASAEQLSELARESGMRSLQEFNRKAAELQKRDAGGKEAKLRVNFGVFFYKGSDHDA